jgi:hypothetical protein
MLAVCGGFDGANNSTAFVTFLAGKKSPSSDLISSNYDLKAV